MIKLDYNPSQRYFLLDTRGERQLTPDVLMREYGFDFSPNSASYPHGVSYTPDPYAAATFANYATPAAIEKLDWIVREITASRAESNTRHIDCPPDKQLEPFQIADVDYIMRREHALDADEPGLGKTPTSVCVANEMQAQRVAVICPAHIRLQWEKRIRQWTTLRDPRIYPVFSSRMGTSKTAEYTICSYDLARVPATLRALCQVDYDLVIFDEVHYAKEIDTGRSRACFGYHDGRKDDGESLDNVTDCLANHAKRMLLLTGTPLPNRPREIYPLGRTACWEAFDWMSQDHFNERFNPMAKRPTATDKVYVQEGVGREGELQNRLRANFMTRHLDVDVRRQMHYPVYDLIHVSETSAVKLALEAESMLHIDPDTLQSIDPNTNLAKFDGQIATVRRQMGEAMAPQAADYIKVLVEGGEKLMIVAWHISVLDILQEKLQHLGLVRIDGRTSAHNKEANKNYFIEHPECRLIIGNMQSIGTGTDGLQEVCSHGIIVEPDWVPGNNVQTFKRLDRFGQHDQVFGEIFVAPGSIAEKILSSSLRKGQTIYKSLDRRFGDEVQLW